MNYRSFIYRVFHETILRGCAPFHDKSDLSSVLINDGHEVMRQVERDPVSNPEES